MKKILKIALVVAACGASSVNASELSGCNTQVSNTHITFNETINKTEKLGEKYANHLSKINGLEKTGYFENLKITQQNVRVSSSYTTYSVPKNSQEVAFNFTLEFAPNHQAYTELAKLNSMNLDIQISERSTGKCN